MKLFILFAFLAGSAAQASTYVCKNLKRQGLAAGVYTVKIKELGSMKYSDKYENVGRAEFLVTSQAPNASKATIVRKGQINTYLEDVVYRAVSKDLGVSFIMFLDEMDASRIEIYSPGKKIALDLNCVEYNAPKI